MVCAGGLCTPKVGAGQICEGDDACGDFDNQCDEVFRSPASFRRSRFLGETACTSDSQFCEPGCSVAAPR